SPSAWWRSVLTVDSWRRVTSRTDYGIRTDLLLCNVGAQDHVHIHAGDHRGGVDDGQLVDVGGNTVEYPLTQFWVGTLPTAEHDCHLDLVSCFQEPANVIDLRLVIVTVDLHTELDRLHLLLPGALTRLLGLLLLFEAVLAVIEQLRNRRLRS